jgi:hypothetical protein
MKSRVHILINLVGTSPASIKLLKPCTRLSLIDSNQFIDLDAVWATSAGIGLSGENSVLIKGIIR